VTLLLKDVAQELGLKVEQRTDDRTDYFCPVHDTSTGDLSLYHGSHFACHKQGGESPATLIMHCKDWDNTDKAVEWMKEHFPESFEEVSEEDIDRRQESRDVLNKATDLAHDTLKKQKQEAIERIKENRNFKQEDIEEVKLGFLSEEDTSVLESRFSDQALVDSGLFVETDNGVFCHLQNRIVFPYMLDGQTYFMIGRRPEGSDMDAKYKKTNTTKYNRHILYTFSSGERDKVIITEGVTDAISAWKAGYDVVSPVTTQFRQADIDKVIDKVKSYEKVYLVNDNDEAGQEGAEKTANELVREEIDPYMVQLEEVDDLDDYTTENGYDIEELLETSNTYIDQLVEKAEEEDVSTYKRKIFSLIAEWPSLDRNPVLSDIPGTSRVTRKEFREWKEEEYEPKKDEKQDLDIEDPVQEDDTITSTLEIDDVEIRLNPVSQVRVHGLQKTVSDLKANDNGAIKPEKEFFKYSFSFGQGAEEDEYTLLTPPEKSINPGDKFLAFKRADISQEPYRSHYRNLYKTEGNEQVSFDKWLEMKSLKTFELAGELDEDSRESVKKLDNQQVRELVEEYLNNGFKYDDRLTKLVYPRILVHDREVVDPQDVMSTQPHSMFFTNTKVGKSFTSERVGQRRDDITPAGLVGYVSAEDGRKSGILHEQTDPVFADEINFGTEEQLNDELLSLLEKGKVTQSKAGEDLITRFYGSLTYMANPVSQEDNVELTDKFLNLIEGLGNNVEAMGSRFGVILFDQDLETVDGTPMNSDRRKKLATLTDWIKKEVSTEYSRIEKQFQEWLSKDFPQSYKNRVNGSKADIFSSKINDFWEAHKESFRHARGQALRAAIYENHLSDLLNGEYDLDEIRKDAEEAFMDLQEINLDSIIKMNKKLDDEDRMIQRSEAILEGTQPLYMKLFVKACIAHSQTKEEEWTEYDPFKSVGDTYRQIKDELDEVSEGDRYFKWSRVTSKVSENRIRKQEELSKRYGLHLTSEKDIDMVKVSDPNTFTPFRKAISYNGVSGDRCDRSDIEKSEKSENVCVRDDEDQGNQGENQGESGGDSHTSSENSENPMSHRSKMSPEEEDDPEDEDEYTVIFDEDDEEEVTE